MVLDINGEEITEIMIVVGLDEVLFVCAWARATGPEINEEKRARQAIVTRMEMLILLPKRVTFKPK